ncbi:hypothetical protein PIB30_078073 [Stylosanthes scabra]|uniref:Uncharacterized protein n=1 Tax=Stylosanthes scabra TaxID=79078 RepID=A0ABU6WQF6_9FABA|nr:hypothetical protein [Stylosanthes scabra]
MGSGVIYYEYEKREKFEDSDVKADAELGMFRIRRCHFDDKFLVHPPQNVRFDPDRPYEIPIETLMEDRTSMLVKIIYGSSMSWNALLSILPFVVVKLLYLMYQQRHLSDRLAVTTIRVMICPEFGSHSRRVRVCRVPRLLVQ